jgi:hypothetical protein
MWVGAFPSRLLLPSCLLVRLAPLWLFSSFSSHTAFSFYGFFFSAVFLCVLCCVVWFCGFYHASFLYLFVYFLFFDALGWSCPRTKRGRSEGGKYGALPSFFFFKLKSPSADLHTHTRMYMYYVLYTRGFR